MQCPFPEQTGTFHRPDEFNGVLVVRRSWINLIGPYLNPPRNHYLLNALQKVKKSLLSEGKMCGSIYMTERGMDDRSEKDRVCH